MRSTVPGYVTDTLERIEEFVRPIAEAGVTPVGIGGDHSVTLAELRAVAKVHGPLGLVHLDSHGDIWESYFGRPYNHGTLFRRALEEGLIDPARSLQAGLRGSLYGPDDLGMHAKLGIEMLTWGELARLEPTEYADRVRARVGAGPAFFTFDIDFVDPSYAPATGTPEVGGPTSFQALELVRALTGHRLPRLRRGRGRPHVRRPGPGHVVDRGERDLRNALIDCAFQPIKGRVALYDLAVRGYMAIVGIKRVLLCALALGLVVPGVASADPSISPAPTSPTSAAPTFSWSDDGSGLPPTSFHVLRGLTCGDGG